MNLFRINFNRVEDLEAAQKRRRTEAGLALALAVLFLLGLSWAFSLNARLGGKMDDFDATRVNLEAQIRELKQGEHYLGEEDVYDFARLIRERIFWTEKLEKLALTVKAPIALTGISYSGRKLVLRGIAPALKDNNRFGSIGALIDSLRAQPAFQKDFPRIDFQSSDRIEFSGKQIVDFEVVCHQE